jgi:hypothetical protein
MCVGEGKERTTAIGVGFFFRANFRLMTILFFQIADNLVYLKKFSRQNLIFYFIKKARFYPKLQQPAKGI